jgi:hypothetical protein
MYFPVELFQNRSRPNMAGIKVLYANIPPTYMATWYTFLEKYPDIPVLSMEDFTKNTYPPEEYYILAPYKELFPDN